jgi:hypothetical protein
MSPRPPFGNQPIRPRDHGGLISVCTDGGRMRGAPGHHCAAKGHRSAGRIVEPQVDSAPSRTRSAWRSSVSWGLRTKARAASVISETASAAAWAWMSATALVPVA